MVVKHHIPPWEGNGPHSPAGRSALRVQAALTLTPRPVIPMLVRTPTARTRQAAERGVQLRVVTGTHLQGA
jgi:hypothetical protein